MIKTKHIIIFLSITLTAAFCLFGIKESSFIGSDESMIGANFPDAGWVIIDRFSGYQTKQDPTKVSNGANPYGQNTIINDGDRISARPFGYEVVGESTTTEDGITSLHSFSRRSGQKILIRTRGTFVEYWSVEGGRWEDIISTSTPNQKYGWADYNINTDLVSYTYFGNGVDPFSRWTGAITVLTEDVNISDNTLKVKDAYDLRATGTVRYCGVDVTYSSRTETEITLTSPSAIECSSGRGVAQSVDEYPSSSYPRGNIYLVSSNRIFISGVSSTPQAVYFSKYGNAMEYLTTLISDSTADAAGIFNLGEGGGAVTAMAMDEGAVYIFKKNITYRVTLDDTLYTLTPLKPFDGKSQTTGCINRDMIFSGANGVYFVTPDNQIMTLSRMADYDYPQISPISYNIQPTVDNFNFTGGAGIFWKQSAYIAAQSQPDGLVPDTILIHNVITDQWESPIIGWAVSDFAIYDDGTGEALYFGDASLSNVYKIINLPFDNEMSFTSSWRSKQFTFNDVAPIANLKEMDSVFVEGYISDNTDLTISLLLDEDGFTQKFSTVLSGSADKNNLFSTEPYNVFGLHPFGFMRFGSSDTQGMKKFRVYLSKDFRAYPFYNAQIEFASDSDGQRWEVTAFGFRLRESSATEKRTLYKTFK